MEKWFSILLDSLKSHKKLHFIMFLLIFAFLIKRYSPYLYTLLHDAVRESISSFYTHTITSIVIFS